MKFIIPLCMLLLISCKAHTQQVKCDNVYRIVDEMPTYKSTLSDLTTDFYKLKINKDCKPEELQQVIWVIDKEGKISSVEVVGPSSKECKDYVIEHAKTMTDWKPGKLKGEAVCVKVTLSVNIRPQ